jgi:hypothetical protein
MLFAVERESILFRRRRRYDCMTTMGVVDTPPESGAGAPQSKTLRQFRAHLATTTIERMNPSP